WCGRCCLGGQGFVKILWARAVQYDSLRYFPNGTAVSDDGYPPGSSRGPDSGYYRSVDHWDTGFGCCNCSSPIRWRICFDVLAGATHRFIDWKCVVEVSYVLTCCVWI